MRWAAGTSGASPRTPNYPSGCSGWLVGPARGPVWGYGIMPLTFEALKGQRYRWCFGGIQILRMHWRSMMPGRPNRANHLTTGQRWAYLAGAVQWYGDLLGLLFLIFLLAARPTWPPGEAAVPQTHRVPRRRRTGDGAARAGARGGPAAPRHRRLLAGCRRRLLHLAVHLGRGGARVGARAVRPQGRVPAHAEDSERTKWWEALRANWAESTLALFGFLGIAGALT